MKPKTIWYKLLRILFSDSFEDHIDDERNAIFNPESGEYLLHFLGNGELYTNWTTDPFPHYDNIIKNYYKVIQTYEQQLWVVPITITSTYYFRTGKTTIKIYHKVVPNFLDAEVYSSWVI